jgi:transcription-repair coupling factor (superfamily II helicase)
VLEFLQKGTNKAKLKQTGRLFLLIVNDVSSMEEMLDFLTELNRFVKKQQVTEST